MAFSHLSNDLVLLLFDYLPNLSLLNFATTCRSLNELAQRSLQTRKAYACYSTICISNPEQDIFPQAPTISSLRSTGYDHPVELIYKLDSDPEVANHVKTITFGVNFDARFFAFSSPMHYGETVEKISKDVQRSLKDMDWLTEDDQNIWIQQITDGDLAPTFFISLSMCSKVDELRLTISHEFSAFELDLTSIVQYLWSQSALPRLEQSPFARSFPRITTIIVSWVYNWLELNSLSSSFLMIPTLRVFKCSKVGSPNGVQRGNFTWPTPRIGDCNVQEVIFKACSISPPNFVAFIEGLPNLTKLEYQDRWDFKTRRRFTDSDDHEGTYNSVEEYVDHIGGYASRSAIFQEQGMTIDIKGKTTCVRKVGYGPEGNYELDEYFSEEEEDEE